jgi:hypothetical protein
MRYVAGNHVHRPSVRAGQECIRRIRCRLGQRVYDLSPQQSLIAPNKGYATIKHINGGTACCRTAPEVLSPIGIPVGACHNCTHLCAHNHLVFWDVEHQRPSELPLWQVL